MSFTEHLAYALGAALAAAAGLGYADHIRKPTATSLESSREPLLLTPTGTIPDDATTVSGRVLEVIDVVKYTYLRLATSQGETWAAVSKAEIAPGSSVTVEHAARMDHFASATLKRTFDVIYFGSLAAAESAAGGLPPGHSMIGSNSQQPTNSHIERDDPGIPQALLDNAGDVMPLGHPSIGQREGAPAVDGAEPIPPGHPNTMTTSETIAVPKLTPASGPNGYVISDLFSKKEQLMGKRVRVRGMVTKVTPDVLGQTFLHVRDGSGNDANKTNDLAVTTKARPALGDIVVFEGLLRVDADLGIGYRYPALLENAAVVNE
jgi:hypothetical protein